MADLEIRSSEFVVGADASDRFPEPSLPEVAFVGRSNVGKSSLINMVLRRRNLARTGGSPGKTRQFNFYLVNEALHVVDLPGLGYARVSRADRNRWARQIAGYLTSRGVLRLVFHLVDSRHGFLQSDDELVEVYRGLDLPVVVVLTKVDKLSGNERSKVRREVAEHLLARGLELPIVLSSARTRRGRQDLLEWIEMALA